MKKIQDILFIVQARLGSTRCPGKMLRPFAGSTLIEILLDKLKNTIIPEQNLFLSAYEQQLKDIALKKDINVFDRSKSSMDWCGGSDVSTIFDWCNCLPFKYVIMISACCPMLKIETINNFIDIYLHTCSDGMFSVIKKKNYIWSTKGDILNNDGSVVAPDTQTVMPFYEAAHCLYAGSMQDIRNNIWMGDLTKTGDVKLIQIPEREAIDIDYEEDFRFAEQLYVLDKQKTQNYCLHYTR